MKIKLFFLFDLFLGWKNDVKCCTNFWELTIHLTELSYFSFSESGLYSQGRNDLDCRSVLHNFSLVIRLKGFATKEKCKAN